MPRSTNTAVYGNNRIDALPPPSSEHFHAHNPNDTRAQRLDITPEVFHRFMTYERDLYAADTDGQATSPIMDPHLQHSLSSHDASTFRRIRAMPKRAPQSFSAFTASPAAPNGSSRVSSKASAAPPRLIAHDDSAAAPRSPFRASPPTPLPNMITQTLSHQFEQLQVSPQIAQSAHHRPSTMSSLPMHVRGKAESAGLFHFPALPAKLTDDSFHYRQRAAQFILLCSQEASLDRLPMLHRLSSPLFRHSATSTSKPASNSRRNATESEAFSVDDAGHASDLDDEDEGVPYYYTGGRNASDDESEFLDFDACRSAHLGNKKKRKSSRFSSPGAAATTSVDDADRHLQADAVSSTQRSDDIVQGRDRALVDRTNTPNQVSSALPARSDQRGKQHEGLPASSTQSLIRTYTVPRPPPRQAGSESHRTALRARLRVRLAYTFHQRSLEAEARSKCEQEARRGKEEAHLKTGADISPSDSPERKVVPKRINKAGKRAQAIRGGGSSAKPLTIAEIRARAAAAASGGAITPAKADRTSSPGRGAKTAEEGTDRQPGKDLMEVKASPKRLSPASPQRKNSDTTVHALANANAAKPKPELNGVAARAKALSRKDVSLPSSSFDFRMSSAATLRLRELRSQLDAASRNLSGTSKAAKALSAAMAAPPPTSHAEPSTNRGDDPGSDAPLWPRHAQQLVMATKSRQASQSTQQRPGASAGSAPMSQTPAPVQARSGSSTPSQSAKQQASPSPATRPKGKATNGRRTTATRKSSTSTSTHKHGHAHGHGRPSGTGSALFTDDDWICVFCEYELYYGEAPLMLRACRNRKKQVEKKDKAKTKLQAALQKKSAKSSGGCQHQHDHDHHGCEHEYDHGSVCGSDDYHDHDHSHHGHDHHHHHGDAGHHHANGKHRQHGHGHHDDDDHRERCDCGNSIHSSDFDEEDK